MRRRLFALALGLATAGCNSEPSPKSAPAARDAAPPSTPANKVQQTPPDGPSDAAEDTTQPVPPVRDDGTVFGATQLMGTSASVNVFVGDGSAAAAGAAMQDAIELMSRIEDVMSEWRPQSELSLLSRAAGGAPMKISADLFTVLERSKQISEATSGAFDVTFHGVGQLWSFKPGAVPPSAAEIRSHLALVDASKLELDEPAQTARLATAGMMIGLGAIAKGYAVDRASALLTKRGFPNHVVEAGGDTFAAGTKGGAKWRVGVQDPGSDTALGFLEVSDLAVVTSGDYQRFFEHNGKRYAHILDPATGWPIEESRSPKSVTLVAKNAMDADAFCTAVAVMGAVRGMAFVEASDDLEAVVITRENEVLVSTGLSDNYVALAVPRKE